MLSLKNIVVQFFQVATFRTAPQDLPASDPVLYLAIGLSLFVGLLRYSILGAGYYSIFRVVLELIVPGVLIYLLLLFYKLPGRFGQTFAAVCGSSSIIYAFALPVLPAFFVASEASPNLLAVYLIIGIDVWSVAVLAFIFKHAVNCGLATGISLSVALVVLTLILVEGISPHRKVPTDGSEISATSSLNPALMRPGT